MRIQSSLLPDIYYVTGNGITDLTYSVNRNINGIYRFYVTRLDVNPVAQQTTAFMITLEFHHI